MIVNMSSTTTDRFVRRSYYMPCFSAGACGRTVKPAPGTTFSVVANVSATAASWVAEEDRAAYGDDLQTFTQLANKLRKSELAAWLEANGGWASPTARKADLVTQAVLISMNRRWPVLVEA